jgi:hypothetical protein
MGSDPVWPVQSDANGLQAHRGPARGHWLVAGRLVAGSRSGVGEHKEATNDADIEYQTAANCTNVCRKIEFNRRWLNLPFSIHAAVADLPEKEQVETHDWASAEENAARGQKTVSKRAAKEWTMNEKWNIRSVKIDNVLLAVILLVLAVIGYFFLVPPAPMVGVYYLD